MLFTTTKARKVERRQKVDQLSDVDHVPTNTYASHNVSQLYNFEDNEAVIKMMIKGLTVPRNMFFFRWMLVCGWTVYLRLTCGTWSLKC